MQLNEHHFLIVDDMKAMRIVVEKLLQELGFERIVKAINGSDALKRIKHSKENADPFTCIISDWNMPVMNGHEFLHQIRGDEFYQQIPFIMLTAEAESSSLKKAEASGVSSYIIKPFKINDLSNVLENVLKLELPKF